MKLSLPNREKQEELKSENKPMNKKLAALAVVGTAGILVKEAVHGYFDVMGRESKYKSLIGYIVAKSENDGPNEFLEFNRSKLEWIKKQNSEKITIKSHRNKKLVGYLTLPAEKSNIFVVFAHGHHTDHNGDPANFLQYYVEKGYNFLAMDHVSCGESDGLFTGFDYFEHKDCLLWIDYLISRFGENIKIILHGVSMGGATTCKMVDSVPEQVKLAVADCPYTSATEEFAETVKGVGIKNPMPLVKAFNAVNKVLAGYDLNDTEVRSSVSNAKVPMLFVHGDNDGLVPTAMGIELYELCSSPKELFIVSGAGHAESIRIDETGYHKKLDEFINTYLGD